MTQQRENRSIDDAVELLKEHGFDGLAEAVSVLLNAAMLSERSDYLGAAPYERSANRVGYANGFKDKTVRSRLGELQLKVPQTREGSFYPQSLEKGLRSERALLLAIANVRPGRVDAAGEEDRRGAMRHGRKLHASLPGRR
jgi:transposase-like protein